MDLTGRGPYARTVRLGASTAAIAMMLTTSAWGQATSSSGSETAAGNTAGEILVTARRKALQTSQEIKRSADTIVDSVTADEAGRLPDNSITEVLQRVSGVSISRFTGAN